MFNIKRLGTLFLLFGFVDVFSAICIGLYVLIETGGFPIYMLWQNQITNIFIILGFVLSFDLIKSCNFNPLAILKRVLFEHYHSLIFLAILSGVFALASGFHPQAVVQTMIYLAIWTSGR